MLFGGDLAAYLPLGSQHYATMSDSPLIPTDSFSFFVAKPGIELELDQ